MLIEKGKMNNIFLIKFENSDYSDEGNLRRWILFKALKLPIPWKGSAFIAECEYQ